MRRNVRALGHVAHVAQVALVDDLAVVSLGYAVDFERGARVDQVEQRRKSGAEVDAAPAAVADLEDAAELFLDRTFVVERFVLPVERVARRRF
jgi:hypothetical protein